MTHSGNGDGTASRPTLRAVLALAILVILAGAALWLVPVSAYLWVKAFHVIAVISWMAGMLYLPRLFVYHVEAGPGTRRSEMLKVMERRLLRAIINPAMTASWVIGLWLAWRIHGFQGGWLHAKLALVLAMSALHGYFSRTVRELAEDRHARSARHWRIVNEAVTILMIGIVILVIVKPF